MYLKSKPVVYSYACLIIKLMGLPFILQINQVTFISRTSFLNGINSTHADVLKYGEVKSMKQVQENFIAGKVLHNYSHKVMSPTAPNLS